MVSRQLRARLQMKAQKPLGHDLVADEAENSSGQGADEHRTSKVANGSPEHGIHPAQQPNLRMNAYEKLIPKAPNEFCEGRRASSNAQPCDSHGPWQTRGEPDETAR